ncbi:pheT [Gossypium arboreum]|uniref:PheT n=1 Tax=Gossypium arboreum TaxID=29729 RepID=A0A0B0P0N8_GOSAR|nr:pheT [Gossypium arboreum]
MDRSAGSEGPAILKLHKWGPSGLPLNLSEYREAFISPTRELLLLLSYQCQALLLPLTTGGSVDTDVSESCHDKSSQNLGLLASRSNLKEDIPSTSGSASDCDDVISLKHGFSRSNGYPFLCDVNSLAWGMCGDTYNQHKDGSFRELLFVSGNQGVMVHAFSHPDNSSEPAAMLEGEFREGKWVEWGPSSSSLPFKHIEAEKPVDLSFEGTQNTINKNIANGNLGVPDKISKKVGVDVLSETSSSKRWLRSFFTKAGTVEYEGSIWTRFPQKSSFPSSAKVVSFGIFTSNFPVLRFLCKENSSSSGESCQETIRNLENGSHENVELGTSDKIHSWNRYGNGCLSDSVLNGFSAASKVTDEKVHDSKIQFHLMRKIFLPTDRYSDDDCICFSPFGITRLIRRHNFKESKNSKIVHFDLHTDSVVQDDRFLNLGSKKFSLKGREELSIGEAIGCTFQGCFYLVTDGGLSVVLPSVSVSSNLLLIETVGYQQPNIGTGIGCQAKNILGLEEPKMFWSPWKVEILDRILLYEGPEEADRLCLENVMVAGTKLGFSCWYPKLLLTNLALCIGPVH